jgi:hypothetical protein
MGGSSHAPRGTIDRAILQGIEGRLHTASHIARTTLGPQRGTMLLTAEFDLAYFPAGVERAYYDIRWYTSDDFSIHYQENWTDGEWKRRWDRHQYDPPQLEEHVHPPPDAGQPDPEAYPTHHFDVLSLVERRTFDHLKNHPKQTDSVP